MVVPYFEGVIFGKLTAADGNDLEASGSTTYPLYLDNLFTGQ